MVEDDATIARVYRGLIRTTGAEVMVAVDGEAAIEALGQSRPDVVLLDLMIPKKNGIEVLKHIRGTPSLAQIPVIVFTNACIGPLMQEAVQAGATQCLVKAQTVPKQLIETLRGYLKSSTPASSAPSKPAVAESPSRAPTATDLPIVPALVEKEETARQVPGQTAEDRTLVTSSRESLISNSRTTIKGLRAELQSLAKEEGNEQGQAHLTELIQQLQELGLSCRAHDFRAILQLANATEALVREFDKNISKLNPSTLRTAAQGLDCLDMLFGRAANGQTDGPGAPLILVLDDDAICRRLISSSLLRTGLRALKLEDPMVALKVLQENPFDLAFLDVMMPGINGFELCKKIRASDSNKSTPVVFVTALADLDSRALSILSGGNDFIGKPFLPAELIVKALVHVLTPRKSPSPIPAARPEAQEPVVACF